MKTKNILLTAIFMLFAFISCNNDNEYLNSESDSSPIFSSSIAEMKNNIPQTKAAGSVWDKNDAIGIYMLKNGQTLAANTMEAENVQYVTANGTEYGEFAPANEAIHFPEDGSKVDFIAYYPYKSGSIINYKYPVDVSVQTSQAAIDFLYSNNATGYDKKNKDVSLKFKHKLTKIIFIISSEDITDLNGLSTIIKGTKTKAAFDLTGGTSALTVDDSSIGDINALTLSTGLRAEAIILPTSGIEEGKFIFTLPSGQSFLWEIPADAVFLESTKYIYNVKLQKAGLVTISPNAQIEDWTEGPSEEIIGKETEEEGGAETGNVELDKLYGYAEGTTGGEGGTVYHFNDGKKFRDWLKLREKNKSTDPVVIWLSGTFTKDDGRDTSSPWFDIKRTSNLSIYGVNGFKMQNVGFFINEASNIIIRNIYIVMPKADNGADGISMQESSKIWVDHCTFESVNQTTDYEDGSCDITHGTNNVTVSWNHFIKTQKSCLVGHSNSQTSDISITATFHHNFFDQSSSRHPRVRFGKAHVYNNFYNKVTTYGVGSAYGAMVLVENNAFDGVHLPTDICTYPAKSSGSNLQGSVAGYLYAADNVYTNKPSNASDPYPFVNVEFKVNQGGKLASPLVRADFTPNYTYIVDNADIINTKVPAGAGVRKLPNFSNAPIPVDNGNMPDTGEPVDPVDPIEPGTELGGGWSAIDMGDDVAAGVNTISADKTSITMAGKGKFESGKQTFNFVYREVTGDFEITAKLNSFTLSSTSNQAEAGLLFTTDISSKLNDFVFAMSAKGGDKKCNYSQRIAAGINSGKGGLPSTTATDASVYLKLRREGDKYFASYSLDGGSTYSPEKSDTFTAGLPEKVFVGLAVNSASNTETATAIFSDIKINGASAGF